MFQSVSSDSESLPAVQVCDSIAICVQVLHVSNPTIAICVQVLHASNPTMSYPVAKNYFYTRGGEVNVLQTKQTFCFCV